MFTFSEFLRKLFSDEHRLISLELDISNDNSSANVNRNLTSNEFVTHCESLPYLKIDLLYD